MATVQQARGRVRQQTPLTEVACAVDDAAGGRVLVFGSPPPEGRDLDLLAREPQQRAIADRLASEGLLAKGARWAAFRDCTAVSVELVPAVQWRLSPRELEALFAQAEVIPGFRNLALPAPHHALLIAARRVKSAGRYDERVRARVAAVISSAPAAWHEAELRASAWEAAGDLSSLRALHLGGTQPTRTARMRSVSARMRAAHTQRRLAASLAWRRLRGRPLIVALSGLDGAGKSFQADRLQAALEGLGLRAAVVWPPAANPLFQADPALKRRLLAVLRALGRSGGHDPAGTPAPRQGETYLEPLPRQRAAVAHALAFMVALAQAWALRRGARRVGARPDVLIYDRYVLDSIVYLRHRWGQGRVFPLQSTLIRCLARRPNRAFLLDVPPDVAYARKQDFPIDNLRERATLYHQVYRQLDCVRLDGELPTERLCAQIARSVWECMG